MKAHITALALATLILPGCITNHHLGTESKDLLAQDIHTLKVLTGAGDLNLMGIEGLENIESTIDIYASMPENMVSAEKTTVRYELSTLSDGVALLEVTIPSSSTITWADVSVRVPDTIHIDLQDESGDVDIESIASASISDSSGDISVRQINGPVSITDGSGDLELQEILGDISVNDESGDIRIQGALGVLSILDGSGDLTVNNLEGMASITDDSGDLTLHDLIGDAHITDTSGDIRLTNIDGIATIFDGAGDIIAVNVGDLNIEGDSSGDVQEN